MGSWNLRAYTGGVEAARRAVVRSAWPVLVGTGVSLPLFAGCGGTEGMATGAGGAGGTTTTSSASGLAGGTGGTGGTGGMGTGAGGSASTSTIPWNGSNFYLYGVNYPWVT